MDRTTSSRVTDRLRVSDLSLPGAIDLWGQYGCKKSHEAVLKLVRERLSREKMMLVVEDDILVNKTHGGPKDFMPALAAFVEQLNEKHPQWVYLLLGGRAVFGNDGRNGKTTIPGISKAGYVLQAHAGLWRQTDRSDEFLGFVLSLL